MCDEEIKQRADSEGWSFGATKAYLESAQMYVDNLNDGGYACVQKPNGEYGIWKLIDGTMCELSH